MSRQKEIDRFYAILRQLEHYTDGKRCLAICTGRMKWPKRGVYFFFEDGEKRSNGEPRVVRIGTHALIEKSRTTLWERLRQHKGTINGMNPGGGDHRVSIFRLHVGVAIISRAGRGMPTWSIGNSADTDVRNSEYPIEREVSTHIGQMPFLLLNVSDEPGPSSVRGFIERNAIGLLSNYGKEPIINSPSASWLGNYSHKLEIRESGLWNVEHVNASPAPGFLDIFERYVTETGNK